MLLPLRKIRPLGLGRRIDGFNLKILHLRQKEQCNYSSMRQRQRWFKAPLKLEHGWVITFHDIQCM